MWIGRTLAFFFLLLIACTSSTAQESNLPSTRRLPRFAIITPSEFAPALETYVAYRRREFDVRVIELESIESDKNVSGDMPEKIKRLLFEFWEGGGRYALLVGDADRMPVRYMVLDRATKEAFDHAFYPSDLYYADVARADGSFDDWNRCRDGHHASYYGEVCGETQKDAPINRDGIDYTPELALGRWPVSTSEEVERVVRKTMRFERGDDSGQSAVGEAAFFCVGGWIDARPVLDAAIERMAGSWRSRRYYFSDGTKDSGQAAPTEASVVAELNRGTSLLVHSGHGNDDRWDGCLKTKSLEKLDGKATPSIMLSIGCSTARFATLPPYEGYRDIFGVDHVGTNAGERFDAPPPPPHWIQAGPHNPPGLGERLIRGIEGGAVAYIGCNTGGQPCATTLLDGFCGALADASIERLGDAWCVAIRHYRKTEKLMELAPDSGWYPPSIFFQAMKYMVFGDPTLCLPRVRLTSRPEVDR